MNELMRKTAQHRDTLARELNSVTAQLDKLIELDKAVATLTAAGYAVLPPHRQCYTAVAIAAPTSVGVHSGQARQSPDIPRAEYMPGACQRAANMQAQANLPQGAVYEWRPVDGTTSFKGTAGPDWVVRSVVGATFPATLIHLPSGRSTRGFPDYASLGRYIRGRNKNLYKEPDNHRLWGHVYDACFHPDA